MPKNHLKTQRLRRLSLSHVPNNEIFSKQQKRDILDEIYHLSLTNSPSSLPFELLRQLLNSSLLNTEEGIMLRRICIEVGAIHMVLNCLGILTHQSNKYQLPGIPTNNGSIVSTSSAISNDCQVYWPKGTGYGTGPTNTCWDIDQSLRAKNTEDDIITVLLQVLSSYIHPCKHVSAEKQGETKIVDQSATQLPPIFYNLLQQSCLMAILRAYVFNDSVLYITRHIPLYRAVLQILRALALSSQLAPLIMHDTTNSNATQSISRQLFNMKNCVAKYASRLKINTKPVQSRKGIDDDEFALFIAEIHKTCAIVQNATNKIDLISNPTERQPQSMEHLYMEVMKELQFDTTEMLTECDNGYRFIISHHYEAMVRAAGDQCLLARVKRLAQEAVTLSTSLPLSYGSSVFVRCDSDRLDIMKVLITGPADTPYANGCFEFDVYFPTSYPNVPLMINLQTTGRGSVRFNPNLYNSGAVCLSLLNTYVGRSEEMWNSQTSSLLQVLVSIQSLIMVPDPFFNAPGTEPSRGTLAGTQSSREYNSQLYYQCVIWAMLNQIKQPSSCFREIIHKHFWMKRQEICDQLEKWLNELHEHKLELSYYELSRNYEILRKELAKLPVPIGLEDLDRPFSAAVSETPARDLGHLDMLFRVIDQCGC